MLRITHTLPGVTSEDLVTSKRPLTPAEREWVTQSEYRKALSDPAYQTANSLYFRELRANNARLFPTYNEYLRNDKILRETDVRLTRGIRICYILLAVEIPFTLIATSLWWFYD